MQVVMQKASLNLQIKVSSFDDIATTKINVLELFYGKSLVVTGEVIGRAQKGN